MRQQWMLRDRLKSQDQSVSGVTILDLKLLERQEEEDEDDEEEDGGE